MVKASDSHVGRSGVRLMPANSGYNLSIYVINKIHFRNTVFKYYVSLLSSQLLFSLIKIRF